MKQYKIKLLLCVIICMFLGTTFAYAESFELEITSDQTQIESGQQITVKVSSKNLKRQIGWFQCFFRHTRV